MINRTIISTILLMIGGQIYAADNRNNADLFWEALSSHCGKAYNGNLPHNHQYHDIFTGEPLVIYVESCTSDEIRIPFQIGEDRSRTFIFTRDEEGLITFKHRQCYENGERAPISRYGGKTNNYGQAAIQVFPADRFTANLIPEATSNVWWWSLSQTTLSYNMVRLHSHHNPFSINFDITNPISQRITPWICNDLKEE